MARPHLSAEEIDSFRVDACVAALGIISRDGLDKLTLRELGRKMGCSHVKPYRYFGDKDGLIDAVRTHAFDRFALYMSGSDPESVNIPPLDRYGHFAAAHPAAFEVMFGFRQSNVSAATRAAEDRAWRTCTEPFRALVDAGDISGDPEEIAHITWVALHGLAALTLSRQLTHGMGQDQIIQALRRLLLGNKAFEMGNRTWSPTEAN